jgi:hypothetical protein
MTNEELWNSQADHQNQWDSLGEDEKLEFVAAQVRARCIELVLAGTAMPVQTRTLEALQRDRRRIAALIEEDGKP